MKTEDPSILLLNTLQYLIFNKERPFHDLKKMNKEDATIILAFSMPTTHRSMHPLFQA
jgi:hypothetical protein